MPFPANIVSEQTMQVGASGPGDVVLMHVITGIANANLGAFSPSGGGFQTQQATYTALVGPTITAAEFRKAMASAALASLTLQGEGSFIEWSVTDVDADFDEESGRVELQFDLRVTVNPSTSAVFGVVGGVGFQVLMLTA